MTGLNINVDESHGEAVCIELQGYVDAHTFELFEEKLENLFACGKFKIVVDLSRLKYISSAGAGVFIGSLGTCQDNDGNIALVAPSPAVKEIFDLLGVFHILPVAATREQALEILTTHV